MMSNQNDIKKLQDIWYQKIKDSGFNDIEDRHGYLKTPDPRTKSFYMRDEIRDFFLSLDHFLTQAPSIDKRHRAILELYSAGLKYTVISQRLNVPYSTVKWIIYKFTKIILISQSPHD